MQMAWRQSAAAWLIQQQVIESPLRRVARPLDCRAASFHSSLVCSPDENPHVNIPSEEPTDAR